MTLQAFSNVFVLLGNCEYREAANNYIFWIYQQHQATMQEVPYDSLQPSIFIFLLKNVKNCSPNMQAAVITL